MPIYSWLEWAVQDSGWCCTDWQLSVLLLIAGAIAASRIEFDNDD